MIKNIVYFSNDDLKLGNKKTKAFFDENSLNINNVIYKENGVYIELSDNVDNIITTDLATDRQIKFAMSLTDKYTKEQLSKMTKKEISSIIKESKDKNDNKKEIKSSKGVKPTNEKLATIQQKKFILDNYEEKGFDINSIDLDTLSRNNAGKIIKEMTLK